MQLEKSIMRKPRLRETNAFFLFSPNEIPSSKSSDVSICPGLNAETRKVKKGALSALGHTSSRGGNSWVYVIRQEKREDGDESSN